MSARGAAVHAAAAADAASASDAAAPGASSAVDAPDGKDGKDGKDSKDGKRRKRKGAADGPAAPTSSDVEFGVSRGVDFTDVTAVINMDLPRGLPTYKHRVGRTARAGQGGTAISMVDEADAADGALLETLSARRASAPGARATKPASNQPRATKP